MKPTVFLTAALLCALSPDSFAKPLKVFILAGQSNMEGHAAVSTFYLKKGKNVLAVYANDQYDLKSPQHYAAIDVRIEGITKADQEKLNLALEEVLSPKDREALKGSSNGGYHYFGSAKIFAQMGKAFAEALLPLREINKKMPEKQ